MASTSSTGAAAASSPIAPAVVRGDVQQPELMSSGHSDSNRTTRVMAPTLSTGCSPNAPAVGGGDVQQLQLPSCNNDSVGNAPAPAPMNPLLLASVCCGSSASGDVQHGVDQPALPAAARLLQSITAEGDTALHAVASHGENTEFLKCASIIDERDQDLLSAVNKMGDTPLHCAARAGHPYLEHPAMEGVEPMLAMASSTGVAPPSSPNALAVGLWDAQQLEVMSSSSGSKDYPTAGDTKPAPINPLLLASACAGSSAALEFLFRREDKQEPPMVIPTQEFLNLLLTPSGLPVPHASDDVEDGVDQPASPSATRLLTGITAEGDTVLHAVASHGDSTQFQQCARIINERDQGLLFAVNRNGDTPLHCAARAGKSQMLSCLIKLAESCNRLHELLRVDNYLMETALHDAVRIGKKDIVESLMEADPELANYPKEDTSPLYLAVILGKDNLAVTLHDKSNGNLSYSGPNGKNVLHAATSRGTGITKLVLKWKNNLTTHGDRDGSTPLHLASSFYSPISFRQLFEANPAPTYQADNNGFFPIHVAASVGRKNTISILLEKFPSSAGLRTAQGQTFLHVAVVKRRLNIVIFVCQAPSLAWILNMQDNDGNTALHLAVMVSRFRIFCCLYGNKAVHLNLANNGDETPADLSKNYLPRGMYYSWNNENRILRALQLCGDNHSGLRLDQYEEKYSRELKPEEKDKEAEKAKDSSQILGIGSVLIATVAFGATFAIPGGFIADDHTNRGTPILAGRYAFDAFIMANALAFICSSVATFGLMFSGTSLFNLVSRQINLGTSYFFMSSSVTCLSAAFALGVYMVLAPVAHATAVVICMLSPLVVIYRSIEFFLKLGILAQPLCVRIGLIRALRWLAETVIVKLVMEFWPFILIFGWASIALKIRNHLW